MKTCPVCTSTRITPSVHRPKLPIFQNVVWDSPDAAIGAPSAPFTLGTCEDCGFSFNRDFDASLVVYDERYDNCVPSAAFHRYYQSLIDMLVSRLGVADGTVYDIGCGKGEFLEMLCNTVPTIRGIGIDPSCIPTERGNFRLIQSFLEPSHFSPDTRLVIVRHVLEHIDQPIAFLEMLRGCVPDVPIFIEVPDFDWILRETAFWDFCYEHCNYFTLPSLATCIGAAGFSVIAQQRSFGDQYQWALCRPSRPIAPPVAGGAGAVAAVQDYCRRETSQIGRLEKLVMQGDGLAVWGMATKGVILCAMLGRERIIGGVDGNPGKQGRFAAGSGVEIHSPEWVRALTPETTMLVMNPNYLPEIGEMVARLGGAVALASV